jgi:putative hydrolase of the HAD superfamily
MYYKGLSTATGAAFISEANQMMFIPASVSNLSLIIAPMSYDVLFFDLDETLYSSSTGLWPAIGERMSRYMIERLCLPAEQVPALRRQYYLTYGTTLRGLQKHYQVDADDYLAYVHDLQLDHYLQPAPELHNLLHSLPHSRWILTNADADHARRVLSVLGLADCFDGIVDVRAMEFACKPEPEAFQRALALAGNPSPQACVLLDDSATNLAGAHHMGFTTVWVRQDSRPDPAVDYFVPRLEELRTAVPAFWEQ